MKGMLVLNSGLDDNDSCSAIIQTIQDSIDALCLLYKFKYNRLRPHPHDIIYTLNSSESDLG